jgi:hypothetical protein
MTNIEKIIFENKFGVKVQDNIMTLTLLHPKGLYQKPPKVTVNLNTYKNIIAMFEELVYISEEEFMEEYNKKELS